MNAPQKLTKRKQKALAFRNRKSSKSRAADGDSAGLEANELPALEVQDLLDDEAISPAVPVAEERGALVDAEGNTARKGKAKAKAKDSDPLAASDTAAPPTKKRKREHGAVDNAVVGSEEPKQPTSEPKRKKKKVASGKVEDEDGGEEGKKAAPVKQRFILFVGNLKYTTTAEAIKTHFSVCDPPPTVRLRTPKPSASSKPVTKSKGCAFVEFSHRNALQQGLKLHQSELDGRRINVELTVGGGGKSEGRLDKLKQRNKGLFDQRKDRNEKLAKKDQSLSSVLDPPQRYSATSGLEQVQSKRKTWSVPDEDDGQTHRGGKKHVKRSRTKQWGTGVNAIPVG